MTRVHADIASKGTWVIDLDGVIWLADDPIPGSAAAVARLRARGLAVVFATNNASPTIAELRTRLADAGIETEPDELVTSAQAAASILEPGSTAVVCADGGVLEALAARGVTVVGEGPADAVVVGWTRQFDFDLLATAATAVRMGARFVGTNEDPTHPTPGRLLPGSGAILAAVATAAQATPEVAGKPHAPLVALLRARAPDAVIMVGDRPSTDGALARRLGIPFALVRTGVTSDGREPMVVEPDEEAPDLLSLVTRHFEAAR
jgi:HAD superfamily hydrolase (TIGR01450 family)